MTLHLLPPLVLVQGQLELVILILNSNSGFFFHTYDFLGTVGGPSPKNMTLKLSCGHLFRCALNF